MDRPLSPASQDRSRPRLRVPRKPFDSFKRILNRKLLARSRSRDRSTSLPRFSCGSIVHAHSIADPTTVPLYLVIHISPSGSIIPPQPSDKIGAIICNCGNQAHNNNSVKNIVFSPRETHLSNDEHFVSSTFVIPEIGESYRRNYKSSPILYRVDISFDFGLGQSFGDFIPFSELEPIIHSHLTNIEALFQSDDVHHVYEKLFGVSLPDETALPSAPPFHQDHHDDGALDEHELDTNPLGPIGRQATNVSQPPPLPPLPKASNENTGILFVCEPPSALSDIPKLKSVRTLERYFISWSQSKYRSIFVVRNLNTREIEFFPFFESRSIPPFSPSAVSPQKMCVVLLSCTEAGVASLSPQLGLTLTPQISKWYNYIYDKVLHKTLFVNNPPPSSFSASINGFTSNSDNSDNESVFVRSPRPSVKPPKNPPPSNLVDVYTPPILTQPDCPELYIKFWSQKATPRFSMNEKGKPIPEPPRNVAPKYPRKMLEVANHVNMPNLLADEFESYAKVYQAIVTEKRYSMVDAKDREHELSIRNDASVLARAGKGKILDDLKKNAPILREQRLEQLTEAQLQSFFVQARTYLFDNEAPYWSFPEYFFNPRTLGSDIFNKITELLLGYPTYKNTLRQFSFFIETLIKQILPIQESFPNSEDRIIENHKSLLLAPSPSIEYTKISLQADAQELLIKSPFYKQNKHSITEELKRKLIDQNKTNLLIKIISNTHFETDLIQLLIANDTYKNLDMVPFPVLISNLEKLILVGQKTDSIEINLAKKTGRQSRPRSRSRPPNTTKKASSPKPPKSPVNFPRSPARSNFPRSPARSPARSGQEACDICLLYEFDPRWCRQQNHCRVSGHQPSSNKSQTRERQIRSGDLSSFVLRQNCTKCYTLVSAVKAPSLWPPPPFAPNLTQPPPRPPSTSRAPPETGWSPWNSFPPSRPPSNFPPSSRPSNPSPSRSSSRSPSRFAASRNSKR